MHACIANGKREDLIVCVKDDVKILLQVRLHFITHVVGDDVLFQVDNFRSNLADPHYINSALYEMKFK